MEWQSNDRLFEVSTATSIFEVSVEQFFFEYFRGMDYDTTEILEVYSLN